MGELRRRKALGAAVLILAACAGLQARPALCETVLITGANSGIGLEFSRQYAAKDWTVIVTHRRAQPPKTLTDLAAHYPKVRVESVDVTSLEQVTALAMRLKDVPIDVLVLNAGVYNDRSKCAADDENCPGDWSTQSFGKLNYALLDTILAVNVKGALLVAEKLLPNVEASKQKKIAAISSSNGSLTGSGIGSGPQQGAIFYRASKAALNRSMQLVAAAVRKDGVTVVMFNPGPTLTEHQSYLKDYKGMLTTAFTVQNMVRTIDKVTIADSGHFLRYDGVSEPW